MDRPRDIHTGAILSFAVESEILKPEWRIDYRGVGTYGLDKENVILIEIDPYQLVSYFRKKYFVLFDIGEPTYKVLRISEFRVYDYFNYLDLKQGIYEKATKGSSHAYEVNLAVEHAEQEVSDHILSELDTRPDYVIVAVLCRNVEILYLGMMHRDTFKHAMELAKHAPIPKGVAIRNESESLNLKEILKF